VESRESATLAGGAPSDNSRKPVPAGPLSVNFLCLIGAMIGLGSIVLPWTWVEIGLWYSDMTLVDTILHARFGLGPVAGLAFAVGTILALAFPAACVLQVVGIVGFYYHWTDRWFPSYMIGGLSVGYLLAIVSSAIVVASVIRPVGPGCSSPPARRLVRIKVAHRTVPSVADGSRNIRQWMVALVAVALLVALPVGAASSISKTPEPLVEVQGGVMAIIGYGQFVYGYWNGSELSVTDGIDNVTWILEKELWQDSGWSSVSFEAKNLSGVVLTPTIVDWSGFGHPSPGDLVALVATWNTGFAEGVKYTMRLITQSPPYPYWTNIETSINTDYYPQLHGFEIAFEFQDGQLSSEYQAINRSGYPVTYSTSDREATVTAFLASAVACVVIYWYWTIMRRGRDRKSLEL